MEYNTGSFGILNVDGMDQPPLLLLDGGIERRFQEGYDYSNNNRFDYHGYLLQITLKGRGCFDKDGQLHEIKENMGFLVRFPEDSRYFLPADSLTPWEFIFLHFDGFAASSFLDKISQNPFTLGINSPPIRMALSLHRKMQTVGRLEKYEGGEFLYRFLCSLLRELEFPSSTDRDAMIPLALRLMKEEYGQLQSIEELAGRLSVSFPHFTRSFGQEVGMTPIQYLTHLRIQAAMNDLLNTEWKVEEIAVKNGFTNGNYFSKVFHKKVGLAPGEYRRKHQP